MAQAGSVSTASGRPFGCGRVALEVFPELFEPAASLAFVASDLRQQRVTGGPRDCGVPQWPSGGFRTD